MIKKYDTESTREAFGRAVKDLMEKDPDVVALAADTGKSMGLGEAEKAFPDRVFNVGIAEQTMVNMAAGMAAVGKEVYIGTYAPFLTLRALEQVRTFVCYPHLPVKMGGALAGLSGGIEGVTHQGIEDIAVMRALPSMNVVVPADAAEAYSAVKRLERWPEPIYFRLGRYPLPAVYSKDSVDFELGKGIWLRRGKDVTLIACGPMVFRSLQAAELLEQKGISASVLDMPSIKPIDRKAIQMAAETTGAIVTAEDHNVIGGLGSAVSEIISETCPIPVIRVGLNDRFAESADQEALMDAYGLRPEDVADAAQKAISLKRCVHG